MAVVRDPAEIASLIDEAISKVGDPRSFSRAANCAGISADEFAYLLSTEAFISVVNNLLIPHKNDAHNLAKIFFGLGILAEQRRKQVN